MITKKPWKEFQETGLLLIVNQILHIFGWSIVLEFYENSDFVSAYPARVKFRGFTGECVNESYKKITSYLINNISDLKEEIKS